MSRHVRWIVFTWALACIPSHAAADGVWERLLTPEPPESAMYREAAHRALEEQQPALAAGAALEALRRSPDSPWAHILLGHARALAGDFMRASDAYERALALSPVALDDVRDAGWAAQAATRAARWPLAERALRVLTVRLARVPARMLAFARLGDVLQTLGPARLDEAMVAYRHAMLDARGYVPSACIGLALALHRAGRESEARGWADRALERASLDELVEDVAGSPSERLARRALIAALAGDRAESRRLYRESAADSPHREHALREARR